VIGPPPDLDRVLSQAGELLRQGAHEQAAAACLAVLAGVPDHGAATHLLGLARGRLGATEEAERLLRRSLALEPANHQFRVNFGNFLRRVGRLAEAEAEYRAVLARHPEAHKAGHQLALTLADQGRQAEAEVESRRLLELHPRDPEVLSLLGYVLTNQRRLIEAEAAYRQALELTPRYGLANHNLGAVLVEMERAEEALEVLTRSEAFGVPPFELNLSRGRALSLLYRFEEAEQAFERAIAERPRHLDAQLNVVRLRFMRSDPFYTRSLDRALQEAPDDIALGSLLANVQFRAGTHARAERTVRDLIQQHGPLPQLRVLLAKILLEIGRVREAESEALEAVTAQPRDALAVDTVIWALLMGGRPHDALPFIQTKRSQEPLNQSWIAHEAVALRLLGRPEHSALFDYGRFVRAYRVEPPPGWSSIEQLNEALIEVLGRRHLFATHPLEQSLRHGTQTTRNLVLDPDPVIQAALRAFQEPLQRYVAELGVHPTHPLLQRNQGRARISEAWSVRLDRDGFHVNHMHPKGWVSSAYYVAVPGEVSDPARRSGWLKFGEPRYPVPAATPEFMVQPVAGLLVLFPSYMWHGTTAIHGDEHRTTIAFDVLPGST
jgi:Flp pilus assembly protein TadD